MRHQIRVGNQDPGRILVRFKNHHRLARLNQQGLILFQVLERLQHRIEGFPTARRLPASAINDQIIGFLGHFRVEIVLKHAVSGFAEPILASQFCSTRRADNTGTGHKILLVVLMSLS